MPTGMMTDSTVRVIDGRAEIDQRFEPGHSNTRLQNVRICEIAPSLQAADLRQFAPLNIPRFRGD